jgi:uncharacterized ParB-like nuclease family protein
MLAPGTRFWQKRQVTPSNNTSAARTCSAHSLAQQAGETAHTQVQGVKGKGLFVPVRRGGAARLHALDAAEVEAEHLLRRGAVRHAARVARGQPIT